MYANITQYLAAERARYCVMFAYMVASSCRARGSARHYRDSP